LANRFALGPAGPILKGGRTVSWCGAGAQEGAGSSAQCNHVRKRLPSAAPRGRAPGL